MALVPSVRGLPRAFWYLWVGTFINRAGGFVVPFLAIYLTDQRGLSVEEAGFTVAVFGAGQLCAGIAGGFIADRFGRRTGMVGGLLLGAAAMGALAFAETKEELLVGTLALGFFGDLYRPAVLAAITDLVPAHDRSRAYGLLYWTINLGFALAPLLAGVLAGQSFKLLFIGDAATTAAFAVLIFLRVPETRPERRGSEASPARQVTIWESLSPIADPVFMGFCTSVLLVAFIFHQSHATLAFDMRAHGISAREFGAVLSLNGWAIILVQPFAINVVTKYRATSVLAISAVVAGLGFGLPALSGTISIFAISVIVWTLAEIAQSPVIPGVISELAPDHLRASYQGMNQVSWGAASFLAPLIGSAIMNRAGSEWLWGGCLLVGAVAALGFLAIAGPCKRRAKQSALTSAPAAHRSAG